jgi:hypothetical protein
MTIPVKTHLGGVFPVSSCFHGLKEKKERRPVAGIEPAAGLDQRGISPAGASFTSRACGYLRSPAGSRWNTTQVSFSGLLLSSQSPWAKYASPRNSPLWIAMNPYQSPGFFRPSTGWIPLAPRRAGGRAIFFCSGLCVPWCGSPRGICASSIYTNRQ